ncbi:hypothetical protein N2152v2_010362 [Parachlorella kessleri]
MASAPEANLLVGASKVKRVQVCKANEQEIAREIKERVGCVALAYEQQLEQPEDFIDYKLPNGQLLKVGHERYRCAEVLLKPWLAGVDAPGVHQVLYESITASPIDLRRDFYSNIILSSGSTMFPGLQQRLARELDELAYLGPAAAATRSQDPRNSSSASNSSRLPVVRQGGSNFVVKVSAPPERMYSVWMGGSILSGLSSFQQNWITEAEYNEYGPSIVHRKCF